MNDMITPVNSTDSPEKLTMMDLWRMSLERAQIERSIDREEPASPLPPAGKAEKLREDIRAGRVKCPSCEARRYVDRSDDPSVSFQTPQKVSPGQSKSAVLSHEREHVVNEGAKARKENREVVSSSVSLQYAKCPDCGKTYVASGLTTTVTRSKSQLEQEAQDNGKKLIAKV